MPAIAGGADVVPFAMVNVSFPPTLDVASLLLPVEPTVLVEFAALAVVPVLLDPFL